MAGRSQLPSPKHSTQRISSVVRTVVEPPAEPPCPAMSRLPCPSGIRPPRASGLRPPRSYGSSPAAPCSPCTPQLRPPQPSGLRAPQIRSGIRPPQASGLRAPRPVSRLPQRGQIPTPRGRSPAPCAPRPCAPAPCAPAPCAPAPAPCAPPPCPPQPCPAASAQAAQEEQEAAIREALRAQWQAALTCHPDTAEQEEERRRAAAREERAARAREIALAELESIVANNERLRREFQDACRNYNITREAVRDMLMEEYDIRVRIRQERMLRREAQRLCSEAQWRGILGLAEWMRETMLEDYKPYAEYEAQFFANHELWEKRKQKYRRRMRLRRPPLSPLEESQVDVFDESPPPCSGPSPMLPERVFDTPPPCGPPLTLMDTSPPWDVDLPPPLLRSFTTEPCPAQDSAEDEWYLEFDTLRNPRRELVFDSEDDDSLLEGAVGGVCM